MKKTISYQINEFVYSARTGNLQAEAVGVVKGEKHFPVFEENLIFKPLTKSKPFSNPLFAYAEVFWSWIIDTYFIPAPQYQLAHCSGYEAVAEKYYDYGTAVPMIYGEGEHLMNLLEFFRAYPDTKVNIDNYVNYCQMFYDYTEIFGSSYFQRHPQIAEELAMQVLLSVLKGDQNYHYENIAFICDDEGEILCLAPMIDHEFSTYFMFPDHMGRHMYWFEELQKSIEGRPVQPDEYAYFSDEQERRLMEKSATCLNKNLMYIRGHYPNITDIFLEKLKKLEEALGENPEQFYVTRCPDYPDYANSDAYLAGKARYKDHDEEKAKIYEMKYGDKNKKINFEIVSSQVIYELKKTIQLMKKVLS